MNRIVEHIEQLEGENLIGEREELFPLVK